MTYLKKFFFLFTLVFLSVFSASVASAAPKLISFQTKIYKPDGTPLEASAVQFKFSLMNPLSTCVIYAETFSNVDLSSSSGSVVLALGDPVKAVRSYPIAGSMKWYDAFNNTTPTYACQATGTFSPSLIDNRRLVMQFNDGSGNGWQTLPPMDINSVPFAMFAELAETVPASGILQGGATPGQVLKWTGTSWAASTDNSTPSGSVSNVSTANSYLSVANGGTTPVLTINVGTGINTVAAGNDARITGAFQAATSLSGDLTGTLPNAVIALGAVTNSKITSMAFSKLTGIPTTLSGHGITMTSADVTTALGYTPGNGSGLVSSVSTDATSGNPITVGGTASAKTINLPKSTSLVNGYLSSADFTLFSSKLSNFTTMISSDVTTALGYTPGSGSGTVGSVTSASTSGNPITVSASSTSPSIDISRATASVNGYLASSDFSIFAAKGSGSVTGATAAATSGNPITVSASSTSPSIDISRATASTNGYLASSDFTTFNNKVSSQWVTNGSGDISRSSGNVGIGTTAPAAIIPGVLTNGSSGKYLEVTSPSTTAPSGLFLRRSDGLTGLDFTNNSNFGDSYIDSRWDNAAASINFRLRTAGTPVTAMTLVGSGNVGIGTQNPTAKLNIIGSDGTASSAPLKFTAGTNLTTPETGAVEYDGTNLSFTDAGATRRTLATTSGVSGSYVAKAGDTMTGALVNNTNSASAALSVTQSGSGNAATFMGGNVGIGTTNPANKLDIVGSLSIASPGLYGALLSINQPSTIGVGANRTVALQNLNTTPGNSVDIAGLDSTGAANAGIAFQFVDHIGTSGSGNILFGTRNAGAWAERMRVSANGNVGIGTTAPAAKLHVAGPSGVTTFTGTAPSGLQIAGGTAVGEFSGLSFGHPTVPNLAYARIGMSNSINGSGLSFGTSNNGALGVTNSAMNIDYNGNVGIGTTAPNSLLHIMSNANSAATARVENQTLGTNAQASHASVNNLGNYTNIGLTSSGWTTSGVYTPDTGYIASSGGNGFVLNVASSAPLRFATSGTERFRIDSAGNVGIGTTTPGYALSVVGDVNVTGNFKINGVNLGGGAVTSVSLDATAGNPITIGGTPTAPTIGLAKATASINGYLASSDFTAFNNKLNSGLLSTKIFVGNSSNLAEAMVISGDATINNLGILTFNNSSTTRSNLGLGTAAALNVPAAGDAGVSEVVRGTDTRLTNSRAPAGTASGDLTGTYPSPVLANIVTAGTGTKITFDAKGRVTASTNINSADVTTALGYTPTNGIGWSDAGAGKINYNGGNVGIGTTTPSESLQVMGNIKAAGYKASDGSVGITGVVPTDSGDYTSSTYNHFINWTNVAPAGAASGISDNSISSYGWHCSPCTLPSIGGIDFGSGNEKVVNRIKLSRHVNPPRDFEFEVSNNSTNGTDGTWASLLSATVQVPSTETAWSTFDFSNSVAYRWYRMRITTMYVTGWALYEWELSNASSMLVKNGLITALPPSITGGSGGAANSQWLTAGLDISYASGNVGIGTTTPGYALSVVGDVNVTGNFKINGVNLGGGAVTSVSSDATAGNPITIGGTATAPTIGISKSTASLNGYLASSDFTTFNSKLTSSLLSAKIFVGNGSNAAESMTLSGDATINNLGILTFNNSSTTRSNLGLGTAAALNVPAAGDAGVSEVVRGTDTRLTNSRAPAGTASGDLTGTYPSPVLANIVTAGTGTKITFDAKGRVTASTNINSSDITTALGYTPTAAGSTHVSFSVNKNAVDQTGLSSGVEALVTWPNESFDTNNYFSANRFSPLIAGKYLVTASAISNSSGRVDISIKKNGTSIASGRANTTVPIGSVTSLIDMNGSTDYLEVYVIVYSTTQIDGTVSGTFFTGSLISSATVSSGGSGTTNYLPVWTSSSILGNSPVAVSGSNVGIGTAAPGAKLHLSGDSAALWPNASMMFQDTGASGLKYAVGSRNGIGFSISDETNSALRFVINNAGNVGIGAVSPTAKLEVQGGLTKLQQEAWIVPTFENSWSDYGSGWSPANYFKDSVGVVHLRGLVQSGTVGACIFTLPVGYRPAYNSIFNVNANSGSARLDIISNGCVLQRDGNNIHTSLESITFRAEN